MLCTAEERQLNVTVRVYSILLKSCKKVQHEAYSSVKLHSNHIILKHFSFKEFKILSETENSWLFSVFLQMYLEDERVIFLSTYLNSRYFTGTDLTIVSTIRHFFLECHIQMKYHFTGK